MKIILLKDVPKVGQKNAVCEVKDGFALNSLLPRGLARQATPNALKQIEKIQVQEERKKEGSDTALQEKISGLGQIEIKVKANEKGHLFAGVGKTEIGKVINISEENILLEHPIKEIGEHEIEIQAGDQVKKIKLLLTAK
jgi:large subunit ribosomal protein L9